MNVCDEVKAEMTVVRIVKNWDKPELMRQTPGSAGFWDGIEFTLKAVAHCDYLLILNHPPEDITVTCPPQHIWAIMQEPPNEYYKNMHWGDVWYHRVYTQREDLLGKRYIHSQPALPWHVNKDYDYLKRCGVPIKDHRLSCVTSDIAYFEGHRARLRFLDKLRQHLEFDLFGRGFSPVQDKWDALASYRYSLAIENFRNSYYWSEKLADCFLAWTMPIYYGCTNIAKYFPSEAMVSIDPDDPTAIERIKETISSDLYHRNLDAIAYARELVLDRYQLFPFIVQQIRDYESSPPSNTSDPVPIALTHKLRLPLDVKVRLAAERYGRQFRSRLKRTL